MITYRKTKPGVHHNKQKNFFNKYPARPRLYNAGKNNSYPYMPADFSNPPLSFYFRFCRMSARALNTAFRSAKNYKNK